MWPAQHHAMSSNDDSPLLSVKHLHTVIALIACHATRRRLRMTGLGAGAVYEHASDRVPPGPFSDELLRRACDSNISGLNGWQAGWPWVLWRCIRSVVRAGSHNRTNMYIFVSFRPSMIHQTVRETEVTRRGGMHMTLHERVARKRPSSLVRRASLWLAYPTGQPLVSCFSLR